MMTMNDLRLALLLGIIFPAVPARAQEHEPPRRFYAEGDDNGVDLASGTMDPHARPLWHPIVSIGDADGGLEESALGGRFEGVPKIVGTWTAGFRGDFATNAISTAWHNESFDDQVGEQSLNSSVQGAGGAAGRCTPHVRCYTAANGDVLEFPDDLDIGGVGSLILLSKVTRANGEVVELHYKKMSYDKGLRTAIRLQSVVSSTGYQLRFSYPSDSFSGSDYAAVYEWATPSDVIAINSSYVYCDPDSSVCDVKAEKWPHAHIDHDYHISAQGLGAVVLSSSITTGLGNVYKYAFEGNVIWGQPYAKKSTYTSPSGYQTQIAFTDDGSHVTSVTTPSGTWSYGANYWVGQDRAPAYVITDPSGVSHKLVVRDVGYDNERVISYTDALDRTRSAEYDALGRMTKYLQPEGNFFQYQYDLAGNQTQVMKVTKPGEVTTAVGAPSGYPDPLTCVETKICAKPQYEYDFNGNKTDLEFSAVHGGIVSRIAPADTSKRRQKTTYRYKQVSALALNANGELVAQTPVWKLASVSRCQSTESCDGTADEVVTTYDYDRNLLPSIETVQTGDGHVLSTTSRTYDAVGNLSSVDGPLPGPGDTTSYRYDLERHLTYVIGPDPDGAGPLSVKVSHYQYDADGNQVEADEGYARDGSDAALASMTVVQRWAYSYDGDRRKTRETLTGGDGVVRRVTQFSYDAAGRPACTAVRMNLADLSKIPDSACVMGPEGERGPDRITKSLYNAAGELVQIRKAVGTSIEQAYETNSYTANGKRCLLIDQNGNSTTYDYDQFDQLAKLSFPAATSGSAFDPSTPERAVASAHPSNSDDYEEYRYDYNGNRTQLYKRDRRLITYRYDALNRVIEKDVPTGCAPRQAGACPDASATRSVFYDYDLLGRETEARYDRLDGEGVSLGYDPLGRLLRSTTTLDGFSQTVSAGYDPAGHRTSLTHAGGTWSYSYDNAGRPTGLYEGATAQGTPLITLNYDDFGLATGQTDSAGSSASISYDAAGLLRQMDRHYAAGSGDVSKQYAIDPASSIYRITQLSGDDRFHGQYDVTRAYEANNLNQYRHVGPRDHGYDDNGNLIKDGASEFGYDAENRLVSTPGARLSYDPLGRLAAITGGTSPTRLLYFGDQLVSEWDGSGTLKDSYVHGVGEDTPLLWYHRGGAGRWLHSDHEGSVVAVTAPGSGALDSANAYDDYGIPSPRNRGRFGFTGQAWLREAGLYYYKARIYSPTLGRFLQVDPVGYKDQNNLYAYVGNDPVNGRDATGTQLSRIPEDLQQLWKNFRNDPVGTVLDVLTSIEPNPTTALAGEIGAARILGIEAEAAEKGGETAAKEGAETRSAVNLGPHAGESIAARSSARDFTKAERSEINRIGAETGCHTCGSKTAGTKSGNFVPDHQPPSTLNKPGDPQRLYPQCLSCSRQQGLEIAKSKLQEQ